MTALFSVMALSGGSVTASISHVAVPPCLAVEESVFLGRTVHPGHPFPLLLARLEIIWARVAYPRTPLMTDAVSIFKPIDGPKVSASSGLRCFVASNSASLRRLIAYPSYVGITPLVARVAIC